MNNNELVSWILELYKENKIYKFYKSKVFRELKKEIFQEHHYECYMCKQKKPAVYTRAYILHHVNEVRDRPDLALSKYYYDNKGIKHIQLMPLCFDCHEVQHKRFAKAEDKPQLNEERW